MIGAGDVVDSRRALVGRSAACIGGLEARWQPSAASSRSTTDGGPPVRTRRMTEVPILDLAAALEA